MAGPLRKELFFAASLTYPGVRFEYSFVDVDELILVVFGEGRELLGLTSRLGLR